jgi:5-hydroxyisourate hydrolase-like protein (transthyretin family)
VTTSVLSKVGTVIALAVGAATLVPIGAAQATTGTDHVLSIDCDADALAGGLAVYDVAVNPGDTITIDNLGGCDADLPDTAFVTTITPPGTPTFTYGVVNPLADGHYEGVVGDLGTNWPIVIGTVAEPTSWISLTVGTGVVKTTPTVTLKGPGKAVKPGATVALKGTVQIPVVRQAAQARTALDLRVKLYKKTDSGWRSIASTKTLDGSFSFDATVKKTTKYEARTVATDYFTVGRSEPVRVEVVKPAPKVVDVSVSRTTVKQGNKVVVSASCGKACAGKDVRLQKRVGGEWRPFAQSTMNDRGRHNFGWHTVTLGTYKMRVVVARYATSKTVMFDVVR